MKKTENYYEFVDKFCERRGIKDEDIIQELYLTVAEILNNNSRSKEHRNIYRCVARKAEKLINKTNEEMPIIPIEDLNFDTIYNIDKTIEYDILKEILPNIIEETLTPREQLVLKLRFDDELTYKQIGDAIGTSCTRPMQIEHKALRKLRHPSRGRKLFIIED